MLYREWNVREQEPAQASALAQQLGVGPLLGGVLAARGYTTAQSARALLDEVQPLPSPFSMQDMDLAVARIQRALEDEELIAVFGDYDVDGITATALLYSYLAELGANVFYKLPSRSDDDYGLSPALVDAMADKGISLIITVDNGTTAFPAAERAKERGVSLVMTDHHLPYDELPDVDALVNPHRADDASACSELSGAGVAFMLLAALEGCAPEELLDEYGDFAAVGTVADVMKLVGPNRVLVREGLRALQATHRPGLRALLQHCGCAEREVTVENISYGIAPRLNAAGRMNDATLALRLLLAEDDEEADAIVQSLQEQNTARQKAEQEILTLIETQLQQDPELARSRVLVIGGDGWHQGVIGIVASRLVDRFAKPAIVVSFDGDEGKGSGRSIAGFSLHGAVSSCEDILLRYGGHDLAIGFSIKRENIHEFRTRINNWAAHHNPVPRLPELWADIAVQANWLTLPAVRELSRLAPCGSGNPAPCFLMRSAQIEGVYAVSEGKHSRLRLKQGDQSFYGVLFGTGPRRLAYHVGDNVDLMLALSVYSGKQGEQVSVRIIAMRPAGLGNEHAAQCAMFENVTAGGDAAAYKEMLLPTRDDTADVYRLLRSQGANSGDLRPLFARLGEQRAGRMLVALAALEELGLIAKDEETAAYRVLQVSEKRDLANSTLLQKLQQAN